MDPRASMSSSSERAGTNGVMKSPPSPPHLGLGFPKPPDYRENGRLYHGWHKGVYFLPCDDLEQERMDIYHRLFQVARKNTQEHSTESSILHIAPVALKPPYDHTKYKAPNYDLAEHETRVLDLGCGTGIWAIDMADCYPNSTVVGVDLSFIQPALKPRNLSWRQMDIEYAWHTLGYDSWDFIHVRMLLGSVTDWSELYHKIFMHLKPGVGWIEHTEIDFEPRCSDNSLPTDCPLTRWYEDIARATSEAHKPIQYTSAFGAELERLGFVNVEEKVIQIPLNPWPTDKKAKELGQWFNLVFSLGAHAMCLAPFSRIFNWRAPDIERFAEDVKKDISNKKYHAYCNMHTWIGRRPETSRPMSRDPEELPDA